MRLLFVCVCVCFNRINDGDFSSAVTGAASEFCAEGVCSVCFKSWVVGLLPFKLVTCF